MQMSSSEPPSEAEPELGDSEDSEYEAGSNSTVATCSSAQLSEEPKKKPRYSCTFHPESKKFTWAIICDRVRENQP